jgi:hypothetical protein
MNNSHESIGLLKFDQQLGVFIGNMHIHTFATLLVSTLFINMSLFVNNDRLVSRMDFHKSCMFSKLGVTFLQLHIDSVIRSCSLVLSLTACMLKTRCRPITHIDQQTSVFALNIDIWTSLFLFLFS